MPVKEKFTITADQARQRGGISAREFAHLFGTSEIGTYRLMDSGKLDYVRIGQRKIIPRSVFMPLLGEAE